MSPKKQFLISVDVEQDISSYLKNSYKGVELGLPPFLDMLENLKIKADFFVTADVCQKYPSIIEKIADNGHTIGSHGLQHQQLWFKSYAKQFDELSMSSKLIEKYIGEKPTMFRAPAFSATPNTLKALEKLNYSIDSSVMPGAVVKKIKGMLKVKSFKDAPRTPYHPSSKDIAKKGNMNIIEVPLSENPIFPGAPFGAGALNLFGIEKMLKATEAISEDYIIFLIHPWEIVNLGKYHPTLKNWVKDICSDDLNNFNEFFVNLVETFEFTTISEMCVSNGDLFEHL